MPAAVAGIFVGWGTGWLGARPAVSDDTVTLLQLPTAGPAAPLKRRRRGRYRVVI
jgi:hypothetical protein